MFKKIHRSFGFSNNQLKVTGYARSDIVAKKADSPDERRSLFSLFGINTKYINHKVILFAPTWKINQNHENTLLGQHLGTILSRLQEFAHKNNALVVFRPHLNTDLPKSDTKFSNLKIIASSDFPDTENLLRISDILVTDWSSIYTDFLATKRPTIFLGTPPDFDGAALKPEDRAGRKVKDFDGLAESLKYALRNPLEYLHEFGDEHTKVTEKAWGGYARREEL